MSQSTGEPVIAPSLQVAERKRFKLDNRYVAPLFITCILLAGHVSYGIREL